MKRKRILIYIALIAAFTIALTMLPIQALYSNSTIMLDSDYYDSHGYICGTNQHWAKYVPIEAVNEGPFEFNAPTLTFLPPGFTYDPPDKGSILTGIEVKTVSGDYAKVDFNSVFGSEEFMLGVCTWSVSWINYQVFTLTLIDMDGGSCCYHVDWIKVWYTGPVMECPQEAWVRTMPMMCQYVWINEDNNFQFKFLYPYADNNWVKIYAMNPDGTAGELVFEADMPHMNPNLIVDLPDGMYIVMTFHDDMANPIQTFTIGKPAPDMEM